MTDLYVAGTIVNLPVVFSDTNGNTIPVASATYTVVDQNSNVIIPETTFDISKTTVQIAAEFNTLLPIDLAALTYYTMDAAMINVAALRVVEFAVLTPEGNTVAVNFSYIIAPPDPLIVGLNSFQTLNQSKMNAMFVGGLTAWNTSTDQQKIGALLEARCRICTYRYTNITIGQNFLNRAIEIGDISFLTPLEFGYLTQRFLNALCFAQVAEANSILAGGDPISLARQSGLISRKVGESQDVYSRVAPVDARICKNSFLYLSKFLSNSHRIARG